MKVWDAHFGREIPLLPSTVTAHNCAASAGTGEFMEVVKRMSEPEDGFDIESDSDLEGRDVPCHRPL